MATKKDIFEQTLTNSYEQGSFVEFIREMISGVKIIAPDKELITYNTYAVFVSKYFHIGEYEDLNGDSIGIFAIELKRGESVERARSAQRSFVKTLLEKGGYAGALVAFYSVSAAGKHLDTWRFSFIRMDYEFTKGKIKETLTPAKRYSYLVGKGEPCHTAMARLLPIFINDENAPTLDELEEAFSVETVTKEFFEQYKEKYLQMKEYLESNEDFVNESQIRGFTSEQFTKKLLAQIVFLYFIQKKGWLGVTAIPPIMMEREYKKAFFAKGARSREMIGRLYKEDSAGTYKIDVAQLEALSDEDEEFLSTIVKGLPWGTGPKDFMRKIFEGCSKRGLNFFDDYLEPLFYTALNRNRGENAFFPPLHRRIPFLNGGLFEELDHYDWENNDFQIPNELFSNRNTKGRDADGVLDIFDRYNFTMAEDEPMEREVAVDPEMLGKVFENLLEVKDRKSKGAFYTPREIVHYMCQESLINYLMTKTGIAEDDIRKLVLYGEYFKEKDAEKTKRVPNKDGKSFHMELDKKKEFEIPASIFSYKDGTNRLMEIDQHLANVKVVDPAVGSGAFPLGMLNEIVKVRDTLSTYISLEMNAFEKKSLFAPGFIGSRNVYELKAETIKNCIFACDIEPSATDIAKLRLWLSLVIDDELTADALDSGVFGEHSKPRQLPNLDCNIICGNSLNDTFGGIELIKESDVINNIVGEHQENLMQSGIDTMISALIDLQGRLFYTKETNEKEEIKRQIQGIYDAIIEEQLRVNPELVEEYRESLEKPSKPFILWQLYFPRVFKDNGGFDIAIGNPPWGADLSKQAKQILKNSYEEIDSSTTNSFAYFIGLSNRICTNCMTFVLPDSLMVKDYAKTRKLIYKNLEEIIWYQNGGVPYEYRSFKSVDHDVCVIRVVQEKQNPTIHVVTNQWIDKEFKRTDSIFSVDEIVRPEFEYSFNLRLQREDLSILEKLMRFPPLSSFMQCHEGIHSGNIREKLFKHEYSPSYKKLFYGGGGGDRVSTYHSQMSGWYVDYRKEIVDKKNGEYASLRDESIFKYPKIYITRTGKPFKAFYDKDSYASNNFFSLQMKDEEDNNEENLLTILPFINSRVCQYFIRVFAAPRLGNTFIETKIFHLLKLPVPPLAEVQRNQLTRLVKQLILTKEQDIEADTAEQEETINQMIYGIYGFSREEIEIIERNS